MVNSEFFNNLLFRYIDFSEYNLLILINMTGIILTGGKSSRMGRNKAFLKVNGEVIIEKITEIKESIGSGVNKMEIREMMKELKSLWKESIE